MVFKLYIPKPAPHVLPAGRLWCTKCGERLMTPYTQKKEPNCGQCSKCRRAIGRPKRILRWDSEFIACIRHPEKRCLRSDYIYTGQRHCSKCHMHNSSGEQYPRVKRAWSSEQRLCRARSTYRDKRIAENKI